MSKLGHKILREVGDAGTKGKQPRNNCSAIKQCLSSSSKDIHSNLIKSFKFQMQDRKMLLTLLTSVVD